MRLLKRSSYAALGVLLTSGVAALAQDKPTEAGPAYRPSLADIMAVTQLRHFKLWYSVRFKNWDLAKYELEQMSASFKTASQLYPSVPAADMSAMGGPTARIAEALNAKDSAKFEAAFGQLTVACNSCHVATERAYIVIRVPTRSPFSNQVFDPQGR